jgi:Fur family ferric uptake transcriptional regulator
MDRVHSDRIGDELRTRGLRATGSRRAVLAALRRSAQPLTHAAACEQVAGRGWNRVTIWRNLLDLVRVGLARRFDLGDHVWRFEAQPAADPAHPHFVCTSCGIVECLDGVSVSIQQAPKSLRSRAVEIQMRGTCDACA